MATAPAAPVRRWDPGPPSFVLPSFTTITRALGCAYPGACRSSGTPKRLHQPIATNGYSLLNHILIHYFSVALGHVAGHHGAAQSLIIAYIQNRPLIEPSAKNAYEHPDKKESTSGSALVHGATVPKTTKTRRPISGPRKTDGQIQADVSSRSLRNPTLFPRRALLPRMATAILHPFPLVGPPPRHTKPSTESSANHADEHPDEKELTSGSALVHGATISRTKKIRRPFFRPRKTNGQYLPRSMSPLFCLRNLPSFSTQSSSELFPLSWATTGTH
jgi:hypothetical protein